jgi:hypothetical protein
MMGQHGGENKNALRRLEEKHYVMVRTLEQQIAEAETRFARLPAQSRQLESRQKIILGGMLLAVARHDPKFAPGSSGQPMKRR